MSVLEALANGAPVLYTTCPALDGLDVDRARQIPSTVEGIREAIAAEKSAGPRERVAAQAVCDEYGIEAVTARIDDLYEELLAGSRRRAMAPRPSAPSPTPYPLAAEGGDGA